MYPLRGLLVGSAILLLSILLATLLATLPAQHTSAEETLAGEIPKGSGIALVHWSGGPIETLQTITGALGCDLVSVWLTVDGAFVGYITDAPDPVNAEWSALVGTTPPPGPLLLVCATIGLYECTGSSVIYDYAYPGPTWSTAWEALQHGTQDLDLPSGTFVETETSDTRVTWEIVARDGIPVAEFSLTRGPVGWGMSSASVCYWP